MIKHFYKTICLTAFLLLIFCSSLKAASTNESPKKVLSIPLADSLELVNFWTVLNGPSWSAIQWDLTQPIATWGGITLTNDLNGIKIIDLSNFGGGNNLSGNLPNLDIPTLERLELRSNSISGSIPNFDLPNLEYLSLSSNNMSGVIPDFDGMPNLTQLRLGQNNLTGDAPLFEALVNLEYLVLQGNDLTGNIPNYSLPNLEYLYLGNTNFEGVIPDFDLPSLIFLSIGGNNLSGPIPNFSGMANLVDLYIYTYNSLSASIPNFQNFPNLVRLSAEQAGLIGEVPAFDNMPSLEFISFRNNMLTGSLPEFDLPSLKEFNIEFNQVSGAIPSYDLPNLEVLNISKNMLTGPLPSDWNLPNLVELIARDNDIGGTLPLLNLPNIEKIYLENNQIEGEIPLLDLPQLEWLELSYNKLSGSIPDLNLPQLEWLSVSGDSLSGPIPDFTGLPKLTYLLAQNNQLSGTIPDFSGTPLLRDIICGLNQLSGPIPNFSSLPVLRQLKLRQNNLTGELPTFDNTPLLDNIDVSYNQLSGPLPNLEALPLFNFEFIVNQFIGCYPTWLCEIGGNVATNWNPGLPDGGSIDAFNNFCQNPASQFGLPCDDGDPTTTGEVIQPDCSCSEVNTFTNFVSGKLFMDTIDNCVHDIDEILLKGWVLTAKNDDITYYGTADSVGNYKIYTDTGNYVLHVEFPNPTWGICPSIQDLPLDFTDPADTLYTDIPALSIYDCPVMSVDVGTPFVRRCFDQNYILHYCNEGAASADDVYVEVIFDEHLMINSSTPPWTSKNGQILTFDIGTAGIGDCGDFSINVSVGCDSLELGETVCVEAYIYPDTVCTPTNPLWDGSTTALAGQCEVDSIKFIIQNTGDSDMSTTLGYIIIEDDLILRSGNFMIPAGGSDSTTVEANGSTFRMEAEQSAFHPTMSMPSISVEGCTNNNQISTGFVSIFSEDDGDPFVSIDCQPNIGSYDPNDKRGFPLGLGPNHIINDSTEIEYLVRFQNTGTDTAFLVVVKDEISEFLNINTLRMGAASHPYTWDITGTGILEVTFSNIMLPDSNVNEPASHGFFKFKIKQASGNAPGTIINNEAAIFFDFNLPIITNLTDHMVEEKLILYDTIHTVYCEEHWFYDQDTTFNSYSSFEHYELYQTTSITFGENDIVYVDTLLLNDTPYDGVIYNSDTTLVYNNENTSGCDSTVYVNLSILTHVFHDDFEQQITLYPNPTKDNAYLLLQLLESTNIKTINLSNQLGQTLMTLKIEDSFSEGEHVIPVQTNGLPRGIYFLSVEGEDGDFWTEKLLIQ